MNANLVSLYIMGSIFLVYFSLSLPAVLQFYCSKIVDKYVEKKLKKQNGN